MTARRRRAGYDPYATKLPPRRGATRRRTWLWLGAGAATVAGGAAFLVTVPAGGSPTAANLELDAVTVDYPVIDLGRVRLDVQVPVAVRLTNQSKRTVILGQATVETLEGC
ncbi:MAG TPA: hypothetical protein VFX49_19260 [Chloroflexota bacterium]|nr:hypothetical protein [Chloroflexota bacterium]